MKKILNNEDVRIFSPKQFLQNKRPEQFSDTTEIEVSQLDRPYLEYYLHSLNTRSQELQFESFAKQLCEKIICPNLLEQTGPVAGGDGKTDTQTFPVSEQNKLLWYEGINNSSHQEPWAFAVSTRKDWKKKCGEDVEKIASTKRGYTNVFCITNQGAKSNQRAALEEQLSRSHNLKVTILDVNWILDQIYKNRLEELAIKALNIPTSYRREISVGANDHKKNIELERLNNVIASDINPENISPTQVDVFLEVAILSRELEKPVLETQGLFDRAINIARKFGMPFQLLDANYEYAKTAYWWMENAKLFEENIQAVFNCLSEDTSSTKWEKLTTLLITYLGNCHRHSISPTESLQKIIDSTEIELSKISQDTSRPSNALHAKLQLCQIDLIKPPIQTEKIKLIFKEILKICQEGESLVGFPFEFVHDLITELDDFFYKIESFIELQDYLTEQSSKRWGEKKAALLQLNRGAKLLNDNRSYSAIRLLGKSLHGLYKEETREELASALALISIAYRKIGLQWASRANLLFAASLLTDQFWKYDQISPIAVRLYEMLLRAEFSFGRLLHVLKWFELICLIQPGLDEPHFTEDEIVQLDVCLNHLILNCSLDELKELEFLPDTLEQLGLFSSHAALLYALGYPEELERHFYKKNKEEVLDFLIKGRDFNIIPPPQKYTSLLVDEVILNTKVMGCNICVYAPNSSPFIYLAESLLSGVESFFATSPEDKFIMISPSFDIYLKRINSNTFSITHEFKKSSEDYTVDILCSSFELNELKQDSEIYLKKWFAKFILECLARICRFKNLDEELQKLIIEDFALHRAVSFSTTFLTINNIFGKNAHQDILDLINGKKGKAYPLKRTHAWDRDFPKAKTAEVQKNIPKVGKGEIPYSDFIQDISHAEIDISNLLKINHWDKAKWNGLGFIGLKDMSPYMLLLFTSPQDAEKLFLDLLAEVGQNDSDNRLRVSIIKGISKKNPHYYRILLGENIYINDSTKLIMAPSRIHTMMPENDKNLSWFIKEYLAHQSYKLSFGISANGKLAPYPKIETIFIKKEGLIIKNAWEIQANDLESAAILAGDDPIIPQNISNAPILDILKRKKYT